MAKKKRLTKYKQKKIKAKPPKDPNRKANKRTANRPTTFEVGNKHGHAGRPVGSPNKIPIQVKEAILIACSKIGSNGKGKDGLVGYLERLGRNEPRTMGALLGRLVPINVNANVGVEHTLLTRTEVLEKLKERGLPVERIFGQQALAPPQAQPLPPLKREEDVVDAVVIEEVKKGDPVQVVPRDDGGDAGKPPLAKPVLSGVAPPRPQARPNVPKVHQHQQQDSDTKH